MFEIRPYPQFSWSYSRARSVEECARAYFYRYYASHNGWLPHGEAHEGARHAYRLKFLSTLHQVLGTAVHECARQCVEAIRDGVPVPTHSEMLTRVLAALRTACARSKDRAAFERDPKRNPMLHSRYYRGTWDLAEVESVKNKMDRCLASLVACPLWAELRTIDPDGIVLIDNLEAVEVGRVRVYAAPDLVIRAGAQVTVVDWKTGAEIDEDEVATQLAVYALVVIRRFGWRFDDHVWSGRVVSLNDGRDHLVSLTRIDLMRASHRIKESVEVMRGYLEDFEQNRPKPVTAFPMLHPAFRSRCLSCPFHEICRPPLPQLPSNGD
jgi:hypothetical protein